MATTKKPTTKKPATKKTAVKKLHYGGDSGFPPRRRRTLGRNVVGSVADQRRRDMEARRRRPIGTPIQQPIGTPNRQLTPEQRKRMIEGMQKTRRRYLSTTPAQRKRQRDANIRRQLERGTTSGGQRITSQMRKILESGLRQPARDRGLNFGNTKALGLPDMNMPPRRRRRRPTGTPVPKVATPRRRPTGTPRGPQITPRRRQIGAFRPRGRR